jgi:hypothetical protein
MRGLEETTGHFLEGAHQSQQAAQNLDELSAKLAEVTRRYRVAEGIARDAKISAPVAS